MVCFVCEDLGRDCRDCRDAARCTLRRRSMVPEELPQVISASKYGITDSRQIRSHDAIDDGRDVMAWAQTGSKTNHYLLPIIRYIRSTRAEWAWVGRVGQALIITPTEESVRQITAMAHQYTGIKIAQLYGEQAPGRRAGISSNTQIQREQLALGCDIMVATPGILLEKDADGGQINFSGLKILVLDEADRLINTGLMEKVELVVDRPTMPKKDARQTLVFSNTFTRDVQNCAGKFLKTDYYYYYY